MSTRPYDREVDATWQWWNSLQPNEQTKQRGDRASLAKLRRASSIMEAAAEPATIDLFRKLGFSSPGQNLPRVALIAAVLAHIRPPERKENLARAIGTPRGGDGTTALITPLRLKRMIAAREPDDLLIAFRRTIAMLDRSANVSDVARQLLLWTDDQHADRARTMFTFDYYDADKYAPDFKSN